VKIFIHAACFVSFGATLASAQAPSAPPQKDVDHCRSLPLSQQWGCFRDLETRLNSASAPQPAPAPPPPQQTPQKPPAAASPKPRPAGGSEELRD
jgi:hypothetical protein